MTGLSLFAIFTFFSDSDVGYLIFHRLIIACTPDIFTFVEILQGNAATQIRCDGLSNDGYIVDF